MKALRTKNKISQHKLSQILSVSPATISRYEKDLISPSEDIIVKTALFFNVSTDYLLGLTACPNIQSDVIKNYENLKEKAERFEQLMNLISQFRDAHDS